MKKLPIMINILVLAGMVVGALLIVLLLQMNSNVDYGEGEISIISLVFGTVLGFGGAIIAIYAKLSGPDDSS